MKSVLKKISLLNLIALKLMLEEDNILVLKSYIDESLKIFDADFGFAWGKFNGHDTNKIAYKSLNSPDGLVVPRKKHNETMKTGNLFFDTDVIKKNYKEDLNGIKSYLMIPIHYGDHVYGNITLCYKKKHGFSKEELALADTIRNMVSRIITVNWLINNEKKILTMAEKQKEIQVLLEQEKQKSEFLANATHEFRTPLAIIRGTADLALRAKGEGQLQEAHKALKDINKEVVNLAQIISDLVILIFSDKKSNNFHNFTSVDLVSIINETIKRAGTLLKAKNISLKTQGVKGKVMVKGDKVNIEKLFVNIIRNAITYGRNGGKILVTIKKLGRKVKVEVKDTGIGISKEDLPHIFERFYRTAKAKEISSTSTGLGLAISRWIVESHDGKIDVQSKEGVGSTFTVTLPALRDYKGA
ncbi:MAG: GAF domain-containing sensor histidine kinase [Patescibacteria group bacterium]